MKLLASVAVILICYMLGNAAAADKSNALARLRGVCELIKHLQNRIESSNMRLADAITEHKSKALEESGFYLCFLPQGRVTVSKAWCDGVSRLALDEGAERIILSLGSDIGLLCREKQLSRLEQALGELEPLCREKENEYNKKVRCYGILGALFGVLAVIVLI